MLLEEQRLFSEEVLLAATAATDQTEGQVREKKPWAGSQDDTGDISRGVRLGAGELVEG